MATKDTGERGSILVVDDNPDNLRVVSTILNDCGFTVRVATNGRRAVKGAEAMPPDLVLMDIHMPEMDGYEACKHMKQTPALSDIPVIFLSALTESFNKVHAFEIGGVDYIQKPFQVEEVVARVTTHIRLHRLQQELQERNDRLEQSYKKLQQFERDREAFTHMLVHDMRTPLMGLSGSFELSRLDGISEEDRQNHLANAGLSCNRLVQLVDNILDVNRAERGPLTIDKQSCDAGSLVDHSVSLLGALTEGYDLVVNKPADELTLRCDTSLIERVLINLMDNALKYGEKGGPIEVSACAANRNVRFEVINRGPLIPEDKREFIFEKYGQLDRDHGSPRVSSGLGLTFCKCAVNAHAGAIGVASDADDRTHFWFELPMA